MKRFIWFILTMALLPVSAFASRDSTATDTLVVASFTQGSKTKRVLLVRAGAWISAIGRVEVDTLKSRSGATIILQGNFVDAAGTQQNFSHVQIDSFSSDSVTVTGNGVVTGNFAIQGGTTIGNATGDALTYHPSAWTLTNAVTITGTWANLGTVTTVDINGGTGDAFVIGGSSAAAGTFTTLKADSTWFGSGDVILAPTQNEFRLGTGFKFSIGDATPNGVAHFVGASAASGAAYTANSILILEDGTNDVAIQFSGPSGRTSSDHIYFGDADADVGEIQYDHTLDRVSLYAKAKTARQEFTTTVSIANGDSLSLTENFFSNASPNGELLIFEDNGGVFAQFFIQSAAVQEMQDYATRASAAKGTATSVNIYWSSVASKHYLENLRGVGQKYTLHYRGY